MSGKDIYWAFDLSGYKMDGRDENTCSLTKSPLSIFDLTKENWTKEARKIIVRWNNDGFCLGLVIYNMLFVPCVS